MRTPVRGDRHQGRRARSGRGVTAVLSLTAGLLLFGSLAGAASAPEGPVPATVPRDGGEVEIRLVSSGPPPAAGLPLTLLALDGSGAFRDGRTGAGGVFRCAGLRPGAYGLFLGTASAPGARLGGILVTGGSTTHARFALGPAAAVERVVVPAGAWTDAQVGPSHSRFTRGEMAATPASFGDPMRAVSAAAGLAVQNDLKSELRIRGGDAADTAVLIDGLPVVHPYHFAGGAGSVSTLDAEALSEARVQAGGFSAEHGDALAGVIDFVTRDEPPGRHAGWAAASTLAAQASFSGPAGSGSYRASSRWSDLGLYRDRVEDDVRDLSLYDLNAALRLPLGEAGRFELGALASGSRTTQDLGAEAIAILEGRGRALRARLDVALGPGVVLRVQASDGDLVAAASGGVLRQDQALSRRDLKVAITGLAGRGHRVTAGLAASRTSGVMSGDVPDGYDRVTSFVARDTGVTGFFIEDLVQAGERLALRLGARVDRGPGSRGAHVGPRLGVDFTPAAGWTVRAGAGRFVQFPRLEQEFLAAGEVLRPQVADHLILGLERARSARLRLSLEGYLKEIDDPIGESVNRFVEFPERLTRFDSGRIRGFELTLAGDPGTGWRWRLCYGRMRVEQEKDGVRSPANTDQRHAASVHLTRRFDGGWEAGAVLRRAAGLPYTPQELRLDGLVYEQRLGALNAGRLPATARLDLRLSRSLPTARGVMQIFVEILNVTDRDNVRSIDLEQDPESGEFFRVVDYQAPLTPIFGFSTEF